MSDRATAGRNVYARNLGVEPAEAERIMTGRAGAIFTREAFEAAGGPGWQSTALTDRDRSIAVSGVPGLSTGSLSRSPNR